MYAAIIGGHLGQGGFEVEVVRLGPSLVDATLDLHAAVANTFLPSATKFQYQFNLRELSAIAQVPHALLTPTLLLTGVLTTPSVTGNSAVVALQ